MSDERTRSLERLWRETNDPRDEAAYLRERLRVGDLTPERLELAAYCGRPGAVVAVGRMPAVSPPFAGEMALLPEGDWRDLGRWVLGLARWGHSLPARATQAAYAAATARTFEAPRRQVNLAVFLRACDESIWDGRPGTSPPFPTGQAEPNEVDRALLFGAQMLREATLILRGELPGSMATEGARTDLEALCKVVVLALSSLRSAGLEVRHCRTLAIEAVLSTAL